ncbi:MAG: exodeoxyribonuclease VII small subunit [Spirochaetota bacterium]|nr:exodeoxyribonuclease VII small subunit [Spirochaetota bacterium]
MEKKGKTSSKLTFEKALRDLENIARLLEGGEIGLEKSIEEFEKGIKLAKYCHEKLEEAERKIEILQKGEDKRIEKKSIKVKEDTGEIEDDKDIQGSLL